MLKKTLKSIIPVIMILSIVMAACTTPAAPTAEPVVEPTEAPAAEEPAVEEPVEEAGPAIDPTGQTITLWHVWGTGLPSETMTAIVDEFNATNEWGIIVDAQDQGNYSDLEDALNVAIQSGDLPDIVTGYTNAMANWYSVDSIIDLTPFIDDEYFGLSDEDKAAFFEGSMAGGQSADGAQFCFPISQSANVLFYNSQWAQELGFDSAPATLAELKEQSCAAAEANNSDDDPDNDGTGGWVINTGASNIASFVFANGGNMLNAAGDGYDFTDQTVVDTAEFYKESFDEGCGFQTESYPNPEFASRKALFTISSTAGLPYQVAAFEAEDAIQDEWTIVQFPGVDGGLSVDLYGQYVAITNTNPERQMAAWVFLKYLTSPEVQAKWIEGSAYYPTRSDTVPLIEAYSQENAIWSTGLSFLDSGKAEPAWASWSQVRRDVGDSFAAILQGSVEDIPATLEALNVTAQEAIDELQ